MEDFCRQITTRFWGDSGQNRVLTTFQDVSRTVRNVGAHMSCRVCRDWSGHWTKKSIPPPLHFFHWFFNIGGGRRGGGSATVPTVAHSVRWRLWRLWRWSAGRKIEFVAHGMDLWRILLPCRIRPGSAERVWNPPQPPSSKCAR